MVDVCGQMKIILGQSIRHIDQLTFLLHSKMKRSILAKCLRQNTPSGSIHISSSPSHQTEVGTDCTTLVVYYLKETIAGR